MTVSVDGLRRNLARAYGKAVSGFHMDNREEIKIGLDDLRQMIGAFMCMYSDDPADLMTNMTGEADKLPFADPEDSDE
jgi:hypothetical protein